MDEVFKTKEEFVAELQLVCDFKNKSKRTLVSLLRANGGKVNIEDEDISLSFIDYEGSFAVNSVDVDDDDDIGLHCVSNENGIDYVFWWFEFEQDTEAVSIIMQAVFDKVG